MSGTLRHAGLASGFPDLKPAGRPTANRSDTILIDRLDPVWIFENAFGH